MFFENLKFEYKLLKYKLINKFTFYKVQFYMWRNKL